MPAKRLQFVIESLVKSDRKHDHFIWKWVREVGIEVNIDKQSK